VAEHLGSDTFLNVMAEGIGTLTVRATGEFDVSYGDQVYVTPDPSKIHRFNTSGGTLT
jgi:multiple sugar transport system ATP-binding protein